MRFKRPQVRYSDTPAPVTPYQAAAQVWDERIGSARVQAKKLTVAGFAKGTSTKPARVTNLNSIRVTNNCTLMPEDTTLPSTRSARNEVLFHSAKGTSTKPATVNFYGN